jgi:diaminohydroxyphosphoribosylaminopyrimidine deaminase/5-amino-6-(5-phosphoribosylamino)uracil reductase
VLTGVGTVLADDPQLNVRELETPRQPLRVVVDSQLRTPPQAKIVQGGALIVGAVDHAAKRQALCDAGAEVAILPSAHGRVDLAALLQALAARGVNELLVEAGATLNGALFEAGWVDELVLYQAPMLLGDSARGLCQWPPLQSMEQRTELQIMDVRQVAKDLRIVARVKVK